MNAFKFTPFSKLRASSYSHSNGDPIPIVLTLVWHCFQIACLLALPGLLGAAVSQELQGADSLSVGSPFNFTITADYAIRDVAVPDTLKDFAVISSKQSPKQTNSWLLQIVPLKTGPLSFPRLRVDAVNAKAEPDSTDGFRVVVLSVLAEGDTLLRDIKPLEKYPFQPPLWVYILLLLLAIALAIYLLRKRTLKPKLEAKAITEPVEKPIPSWQKALAELSALEAEGLLDKDELLQYHFRLSAILRAFLEALYRFPALEMTTREIAQVMATRMLDKGSKIREFLVFCDMVKFAKTRPERDKTEYYTTWLRSYLGSFAGEAEVRSDA